MEPDFRPLFDPRKHWVFFKIYRKTLFSVDGRPRISHLDHVESNNSKPKQNMSNTSKYFAKSAITGLYWDGRSFGSIEPTTYFNAPEIAFIRATWDNVIAVLLTPEQEANAEGWSLEWFR